MRPLWAAAIIAFLGLVPAPASALTSSDDEEEAPPRNAIYLHPLSFLKSTLQVEYERVMGDTVTVFVAPNVRVGAREWTTLPGDMQAADVTVLGLGTYLGLRHYFYEQSLHGPFVGPELAAHHLSVNSGGRRGSATSLTALGMLGYTHVTVRGYVWTAGFAVGTAYVMTGGQLAITRAGLQLALGARLGVGYSF